jgi:hypothetical protein
MVERAALNQNKNRSSAWPAFKKYSKPCSNIAVILMQN